MSNPKVEPVVASSSQQVATAPPIKRSLAARLAAAAPYSPQAQKMLSDELSKIEGSTVQESSCAHETVTPAPDNATPTPRVPIDRQKQYEDFHNHVRAFDTAGAEYARAHYVTEATLANSSRRTGVHEFVTKAKLTPVPERDLAAKLRGFQPVEYVPCSNGQGEDNIPADDPAERELAQLSADVDRPAKAEWSDVGIQSEIAIALEASGRARPYPVQRSVLRSVLTNGWQAVITAPHAVGKTEALVILAVQAAENARRRNGDMRARVDTADQPPPYAESIAPTVIIIVPTHELGGEVTRLTRELIRLSNLKLDVQPAWGGLQYLRRGANGFPDVHIVICCVGRLHHMLCSRDVRLDSLRLLIVDEIQSVCGQDLDYSEDHLKEIFLQIAGLRLDRTRIVLAGPLLSDQLGLQLMNQLFDAHRTLVMHIKWPLAVDAAVLTSTEYVNIRDPHGDSATIDELITIVPGNDTFHMRLRALIAAIHKDQGRLDATGYVLIVCGRRTTTERVELAFCEATVTGEEPTKVSSLVSHGGVSEAERAANNDAFNEGKIQYFFTTQAVGGIGRNFTCKPTVISFDSSEYAGMTALEDHLALTTRTGWFGNTGRCTTLLDPIHNGDRELIIEVVARLLTSNGSIPRFMWDVAETNTVAALYGIDTEYQDEETSQQMVRCKLKEVDENSGEDGGDGFSATGVMGSGEDGHATTANARW